MPHHPWLSIPASDYESHMGPKAADQLAPLSAIFAEVYREVRPARLGVLGCATGNGFEHVDPAITSYLLGVDVNSEYLAIATDRFRHLGSMLELRCADVEDESFSAGPLDLIHAALLFEHVDPEPLAARIPRWLAPRGVCSVVLQLPGGDAPVTASPHASIQALASTMSLVAPNALARAFKRSGLACGRAWEVLVRGGKRLHVSVFAA